MAGKLLMLALSPTMESGRIARWHVEENGSFAQGDVLCEVETDKATMDYEATESGTLRKIVASAGSKVRVGEVIALTGGDDEDIGPLLAEIGSDAPADAAPPMETGESSGSVAGQPITPDAVSHLPDGVKASPLARELARQRGVRLQSVTGSGPGGRIVKDDVERAASFTNQMTFHAGTPSGSDIVIPVSDKRRIVASRLTESKLNSPHFYLTVKAAMDSLIEARREINSRAEPHLSLNAFVVKLVAEALRRHPDVNASWEGDTIIRHGSVDVALAVAQPDGLVTPVVRNAAQKGIVAIDDELRDLIGRAREGRLSPEEYSDSTFTISNLGSYGVRQFTAIINPPNAAILAVGEIFREPYEAENKTVAFRSAMYLTLSCDHRIIDGAAAATFARDLREMIERPVSALL